MLRGDGGKGLGTCKRNPFLPPCNRGYGWEFLREKSYCGDISKEKPKLCKPILPSLFLLYLSIYSFSFKTPRFKSVITLNSSPTNFIFPLYPKEAPFVFRKARWFLLICKSGLYLRALHSVHRYYTFRVSEWIREKVKDLKMAPPPDPLPLSPNVIPVQSFEDPYALQANLGTSYIKLRQGKMSSLISRNGAVTEVLLPDLYLTPLLRPQLRSVVFKG